MANPNMFDYRSLPNFPGMGGSGGGSGFLSGLSNFMSGPGFSNVMDLGSLALNAYGLNQSLDIADQQLGILQDQENRAATAQNFQTGNSLAMALQMTTPGTPEHERVKQAMANGTYQV